MTSPADPGGVAEEFLADEPIGLAVLRAVRESLARYDDVAERVSVSQVAFRRRRGFAYLWRPGRWLRGPDVAPVVLSIALERSDSSARWKEVAHPSPRVWMHHLEVRDPSDVDAEVGAWLVEAADAAGPAVDRSSQGRGARAD